MAEKKAQVCLFTEHFSRISDPRETHKVLYPLQEILLITVCAAIGGADGWVDVALFGEAKKEFFQRLVPLEKGIPSHDTFGDVFAAIEPQQFKECFVNWAGSLRTQVKDIVAIDGKTLRRSYEKAGDKSAIHMVSAWANRQRLVLGQERVSDKSNEITAIPRLLQLLELSGAIVTIDAMGCQKEIAKEIISKGADYVLALKGNQGQLHEDVTLFLAEQKDSHDALELARHETTDGDHGRIETRRYGVTDEIDWLKKRHDWTGLRSIGFVESIREVNNKISKETRYYISSLPSDAEQFAQAVREHWGIENSLHWVLDVNFKDDSCRVRRDNAPENFTIIKHIALNLLQKERASRKSMNSKRRLAGWNNDYLLTVLTQ